MCPGADVSDFDDEPTTDAAVDDDGWDDEVAPKPPRRPRKPPADDDDWDDDWDRDDRGGRKDMTLVYAVVAAAIVIVLAVVLTQDKDSGSNDGAPANGAQTNTSQPAAPEKNWQGAVGDAVGDKGSDAQSRAESAPGVYIWTDFWGWHVRNNGTSDVVVTVAADQVRVKDSDDYNDDNEDSTTAFKTEAQVTLPAGDGSTGSGFDLGVSESATFTVTAGGENVPAEQIMLGGGEGVADESPVTFTKA